jgi:hypothetical protein
MKIASIKMLVNNYSIEQLELAAEEMYNEQPLPFEVEGAHEGEKLTHILAAIEILKDMSNGNSYQISLRNYAARVRNSIN